MYFRIFLDYVNPVTNRILSNSNSIIKSYTKDLFIKGKYRLRYILTTALSDIYIIYNI